MPSPDVMGALLGPTTKQGRGEGALSPDAGRGLLGPTKLPYPIVASTYVRPPLQ